MKPRLPRSGLWRSLIAIASVCVITACGSGRPERVDLLAHRPDLRDDFRTFSVRCSKCHSLSRPLNSGITDDTHWDRYVARMRRQPGSGITQSDAVAILRFLHAYSAEERRRQQGASQTQRSWLGEAGGPP
ncbi:MAG TPA: hypothetical protein VIV60_31720 [Polyangiaceae bacterium]